MQVVARYFFNHFVGGAPIPVLDLTPCGCSTLCEWVAFSAMAGPVKPTGP